MNITPVNYTNRSYQCGPCRKPANNATPTFGAIHFTPSARSQITEHLNLADFFTRNEIMHKLEKIILEGENTRDILVDAPSFTTGLIAKVSTKNPKKGKPYGLKTYIQSEVYNIKFLEDALNESKTQLP